MTPKEKAEELFQKYYKKPLRYWSSVRNYKLFSMSKNEAKECALISVDEILDALDKSLIYADIEFWQQVKQEIEKL